MSLNINELRRRLSYNPDTGEFRWLSCPSGNVPSGTVAGSDAVNGYRQIRFANSTYYAHRLAWAYVHGKLPEHLIDHVNRVRNDNRIDNLREVDGSQNCQNMGPRTDNKTGVRGVSWHAQRGKWRAKIKNKHLGLFDNIAQAEAAYKAAADKLFTHHTT